MPFIYRCFDKETKETIYVGSCKRNYLWERTAPHKYDYTHNITSTPLYKYIREHKGWDGYSFEILIDYDKITKEALLYEERRLIDELQPVCNFIKPIASREEILENMRNNSNRKVTCPLCQLQMNNSSLPRHKRLLHKD